MAEVLSQSEIDALLNNVKSGREDRKDSTKDREVVPFDFRLPNRISKNQLRTQSDGLCDLENVPKSIALRQ